MGRSWLSVKFVDLVGVALDHPELVEGLRLALGVDRRPGAVHVVGVLDGDLPDREGFLAELALVADDLVDVLPDVRLPVRPAARMAATNGTMPSPAADGPGR